MNQRETQKLCPGLRTNTILLPASQAGMAKTEPRIRKLMGDMLGVVSGHLGHPLSWLPSSCRCQDDETRRAAVIHDPHLPVSSRVPQRISKWSMAREWEEQTSVGRRATFRIRGIREEEAGKNGTGPRWIFPHRPPPSLPPHPTLESQKSHGKIYALSVRYIQATDTQGFSLFLSHPLSLPLSLSLLLCINIISLSVFRGKVLKWLEKRNTSGLPWWRSGWESACQCRAHVFVLRSARIPLCRAEAGPASHTYWACAFGACAPQRERPR